MFEEKRLVRVTLKGRCDPEEDEETMVVDLLVDSSHRVCSPVGKPALHRVSGWLGTPRSRNTEEDTWFYPFVIVPPKADVVEAFMDFGRACEDDREGRTNLLSKEIRNGELATVWMLNDGSEEEYLMRITSVDELLVAAIARQA